MLTEMPNNLLNMAESFDGELKFTELDLLEQDAQTFLLASGNRRKQASEVADFYNVPLQLLKEEEKENIKQVLTTGSYDEKVTVLTNLAILGRRFKKCFCSIRYGKRCILLHSCWINDFGKWWSNG